MRSLILASLLCVASVSTAVADDAPAAVANKRLALVLPNVVVLTDSDETIPLPGLELELLLSPRWSASVAIGAMPVGGATHAFFDATGRGRLWRELFGFARAGVYSSGNDEGDSTSILSVGAGAGYEWLLGRFSVLAEAGVASARLSGGSRLDAEWDVGAVGRLALGRRF